MTARLSPEIAWQPLPPEEWNADAARHLLRRAGWTAAPSEVSRSVRDGLSATLDRLFPEQPILFPKPELTEKVEREWPEDQARLAAADPEGRRAIRRAMREASQAALLDMSVRWLEFALRPENSSFAKWTLFLGDVYVVGFQKVPRIPLIYRHLDIIGRNALGSAPMLAKAVSRSPAMLLYLDLNGSRPEAPNENFARELFELFLLGEGNYTEKDIKEAARAFTGYRVHPPGAEFVFAPRQHDPGIKTVFGHSGYLGGDQVIDLAYGQRAAGAFLPHELVKFYLSDTILPPDVLFSIGDLWRTQGYDLRWLAHRFFGSRIFFAPEFRGDFIKSPVQLYLGLLQDLDLNVAPLPRYALNPLRQMGQVLFNPPNVRGWVGGRNWINSASFAARRTMVEMLFTPIPETRLNADELADLAANRSGDHFTVSEAWLESLAELTPDEIAGRLAEQFLPGTPSPPYRASLENYLAKTGFNKAERLRRAKRAAITVLSSPEYQLC